MLPYMAYMDPMGNNLNLWFLATRGFAEDKDWTFSQTSILPGTSTDQPQVDPSRVDLRSESSLN